MMCSRMMIIPAAGIGSRLGASTPKPLVPVNGRAMIDHVLDLYAPFVGRFVVVVHPSVEPLMRAHCASRLETIDFEVQPSPTGMLDAILLACQHVAACRPDNVWITWCDQICVHTATVEALAQVSSDPNVAMTLPTVRRRHPYVHLQRDSEGRITKVLHRREGDRIPEDGESEIGLFALSRAAYVDRLPEFTHVLDIGAATGERNFLPFIPWLSARATVRTFPAHEEMEAVGINTPAELAAVEAYLRARDMKSRGMAPGIEERARVRPSARSTLSIIIPAYNEEQFITTLLEKVKAVDLSRLGLDKQIVVVDDCSRDRTVELASAIDGVIVKRMTRNSGKGSAVRAGIECATGDYIIIQDADLEYDPNDYVQMLEALLGGAGDVVYGSRYLKQPDRGRFVNLVNGRYAGQSLLAYIGGQSLSFVALLLTGTYITDTVTALKLFPARVLKKLTLTTTGFELDHEISAKVLAAGHLIAEVPIRYYPRTKAEGKKIGARDWLIATRTFFRFRNG